jgi:hypothetical protein
MPCHIEAATGGAPLAPLTTIIFSGAHTAAVAASCGNRRPARPTLCGSTSRRCPVPACGAGPGLMRNVLVVAATCRASFTTRLHRPQGPAGPRRRAVRLFAIPGRVDARSLLWSRPILAGMCQIPTFGESVEQSPVLIEPIGRELRIGRTFVKFQLLASPNASNSLTYYVVATVEIQQNKRREER